MYYRIKHISKLFLLLYYCFYILMFFSNGSISKWLICSISKIAWRSQSAVLFCWKDASTGSD